MKTISFPVQPMHRMMLQNIYNHLESPKYDDLYMCAVAAEHLSDIIEKITTTKWRIKPNANKYDLKAVLEEFLI